MDLYPGGGRPSYRQGSFAHGAGGVPPKPEGDPRFELRRVAGYEIEAVREVPIAHPGFGHEPVESLENRAGVPIAGHGVPEHGYGDGVRVQVLVGVVIGSEEHLLAEEVSHDCAVVERDCARRSLLSQQGRHLELAGGRVFQPGREEREPRAAGRMACGEQARRCGNVRGSKRFDFDGRNGWPPWERIVQEWGHRRC